MSVCVRASRRFEKSTSNLDLPKPLSRKRRRCQDVQHQKVSTMSLLIYSYLLIKIPAEISGHFKMASADNGWHFWSAAFRRWLWTWKDIYAKKCDGCFRVTTHTKKKINKNNTKQTLTYIICFGCCLPLKQRCKYSHTGSVGGLGNPGYTSPRLCVHSVFLMWPVVAYSLHKSFISLAFLDVDCRVEVVTLLSQCV